MGKIGWGEFLIILIIALVVVGPDKLPKLGRSIGQAIGAVKKYVNETAKEMDGIDEIKNVKSDLDSIRKDVTSMGRSIEKSVEETATAGKPDAAPPAAKPAAEPAEEQAAPATAEELEPAAETNETITE